MFRKASDRESSLTPLLTLLHPVLLGKLLEISFFGKIPHWYGIGGVWKSALFTETELPSALGDIQHPYIRAVITGAAKLCIESAG